jgi:hypothetical protein
MAIPLDITRLCGSSLFGGGSRGRSFFPLNLSAMKQKNSRSISKKASLTPAGGMQGTGAGRLTSIRFEKGLLKNIPSPFKKCGPVFTPSHTGGLIRRLLPARPEKGCTKKKEGPIFPVGAAVVTSIFSWNPETRAFLAKTCG